MVTGPKNEKEIIISQLVATTTHLDPLKSECDLKSQPKEAFGSFKITGKS